MRNVFTTFIALLLSVSMQAQHSQAEAVEPASKGTLSELPQIGQAEEGHFGALFLSSIDLASFQSSGSWSYEAEFTFPKATSLGGESYTMQRLQTDSYGETSWNDIGTATSDNYTVSPGGYFRLVLNGGEKDGWISNEVYVPRPSIPCQLASMTDPWASNTFVGTQVRGSYLTIRLYDDSWDYTKLEEDPSFVRSWYRRNPNTGEMIDTGKKGGAYTIVSEDVGYEIVEVVKGDKEKTDFYVANSVGIAQMNIACSAEFFYEGFIVNCEYDVPQPQTFFGRQVYDSEVGGNVVQPFAAEDVKVLAPGRYAIYYPWENYGFGEEVHCTIASIGLCENHGTYNQQFRLWAAPGSLETTAKQNGTAVEGALINMLENNIDGNMQYVNTYAAGDIMYPSYINHYAKAVNVGDGNLPTYYPSALLWTDAQSIDIQQIYYSESGPSSIDIEVRPQFAALGGPCTIDGQINGSVPVPIPLVSDDESRSIETPGADPVYVYLRQQDGDIIAAAMMQADGSYHFGEVPYGTYEVIPNIDGHKVQVQSVTLSEENAAANMGDYTIGDYVITSEVIDGINLVDAAAGNNDAIYDLSGRRMPNKPARGLYIRNGKKYLAK